MSDHVDEPASAPPSAARPPAPQPSRPAGKPREFPWRLILLAAVGIYAVLFVILNAHEVRVSFVFFTVRVSLVVALVLALLIGFLGGYLFDTARTRKKRKAEG